MGAPCFSGWMTIAGRVDGAAGASAGKAAAGPEARKRGKKSAAAIKTTIKKSSSGGGQPNSSSQSRLKWPGCCRGGTCSKVSSFLSAARRRQPARDKSMTGRGASSAGTGHGRRCSRIISLEDCSASSVWSRAAHELSAAGDSSSAKTWQWPMASATSRSAAAGSPLAEPDSSTRTPRRRK